MAKNIYAKYTKAEILGIVPLIPLDDKFPQYIAMALHSYKELLGYGEHDRSLAKFDKAICQNRGIVKKLGSGAFATVYEGTDGFAYKVSLSSMSDDIWLVYAKASKRTNNPLFPKILNLHTFEAEYCCKMEKLEKVKIKKNQGNFFNDLSKCFYEGKIKKAVEQLNKISTVEYKDYKKWSNKIGYILDNEYMAELDLHIGNIMFRGSQLVMTDPIA